MGSPVTKTLLVPTGRHARLLYGLCRRGPIPEPVRTVDGWDCYEVDGLDGGQARLALPTPPSSTSGAEAPQPADQSPDEMALAGLHHAATDEGALVELVVLVSRLLELAGHAGLWHWQRVIEVLYGARARPDRHNDPVKQLLALLERARWNFSPETSTSPTTWSQLVVTERHHRSSRTVHLDADFRQELASVAYEASPEVFLIGPPATPLDPSRPELGEARVANPEGNLPSRRARARARVGLLLKVAPRRRGERPKDQLACELERLVIDAGGDIERVQRRRHVQPWGLALRDELTKASTTLGVVLVSVKEQVGSILRAVLHIERPPTREAARPPQDAPATRTGSRGPP